MENIDESIIEIIKYLKKLPSVIDNNVKFSLFNSKYVEKNKIDDVWVCMEANFPAEYRKLLKQPKANKYKSVALYHQLRFAITKKSKLFPSCYSISFNETASLLKSFGIFVEQDIRLLYKSL